MNNYILDRIKMSTNISNYILCKTITKLFPIKKNELKNK